MGKEKRNMLGLVLRTLHNCRGPPPYKTSLRKGHLVCFPSVRESYRRF